MSTWLSIETAPKDGTEIIALFESGGVYCIRVMWYFTDAEYDNINPQGTREQNVGWWSMLHSVRSEKVKPTHWLPLPEYPTK